MQVTLEKTNDLDATIKVEVVEADYAKKVDSDLRELGRTRQIPGFRKGHVSIEHLRRLFGRDVKSHVLNDEVFKAVIEYLRENKIDILGEPLPKKVEEIDMKQKDYTFEYEVGLAPALDIEVNKDVKVPFYTIEVSKEMLDEQDKALRNRFGAQIPGEEVNETALVKGAIMQLDAEGNVMTSEDAIQVVAGIVSPQHFQDKDEAAKFLGKKVGDKVVFNPAKAEGDNKVALASMLNVDKERVEGLTSDFEMAVSEIIVLKPAELGEEFYKEVFAGKEIKSEEEYFEGLKEIIARELAPNSNFKFNMDVQQALVEKFGNFELPAEFLKKWLVARNPELTAEKADAEFDTMIPSIKWELIKGKIAEKQDIKVTEEDLLAFAKATALRQFAQYGMMNMADDVITDYAKRMLEDRKFAGQLHEQAGDMKLFNALRALVDTEDKTVSLDEFKKLVGAE
ncbi:MAG: trigger factor [Muribaculaceae bacterium]